MSADGTSRIKGGVDHLDLILATSEIGIWELDVATGVALRNLRHDQIFGYDRILDEWSAEIFMSHVAEEDRERIGELLSVAIENQTPWEFEARIRRADGAWRWISAKGTPKFDGDGQMTKLIGHVIDVTANKETEDRLKLLTQELNHRVANTFTILNAMIRHSARKSASVEDFAETLNHRLSSLARSNRILTARESERSNLHEILEMEMAAFEGWRQRINLHGDADLWFSGEASEALSLIFHELLTNAVKYGALSAPSGHVDIAINHHADGETEISWVETGGPPVPAERTPGIGSTILAHAMRDQGHVELDYAEPGLRCSIVVNSSFRRKVLDELLPNADQPATAGVEFSAALDGRRIVVVEDDPIIGLDIADILEANGATVLGPYGEPDAAIAAISARPDAAILDVNLGHVTSSGVASRLALERIPFLILSGQTGRSDLDAAFGDAPLVNKPFREQELVNGLAALLSSSA